MEHGCAWSAALSVLNGSVLAGVAGALMATAELRRATSDGAACATSSTRGDQLLVDLRGHTGLLCWTSTISSPCTGQAVATTTRKFAMAPPGVNWRFRCASAWSSNGSETDAVGAFAVGLHPKTTCALEAMAIKINVLSNKKCWPSTWKLALLLLH